VCGRSPVSRAVSETTVRKGVFELEAGGQPMVDGRVRRPGGGRKSAGELDPGLTPALLALVEPDERGDPMSPLRWTTKSLRNLAEELTRQGHPVSAMTVGNLLKDNGFSLQAQAKMLEGEQHPDRDTQFRYINEQVKQQQAAGEPVISVDTKKSPCVRGARGSDEMLTGPAGRGRRLLIGACEPARSLARGPSGPGIVAVSTNPRIV